MPTEPSARLAVPTAPAASLAAVTAPSASFALVTAPSASFELVTAPSTRSGGPSVPSSTFAPDTELAASLAPVTAPVARSAVCTAPSAIRLEPTGAIARRAFESARAAMWKARSTVDTTSVFFLANAGAANASAITPASSATTWDRFIDLLLFPIGALLGSPSSRMGFAGL